MAIIIKKLVPASSIEKSSFWRAKKPQGYPEHKKYSYIGLEKRGNTNGPTHTNLRVQAQRSLNSWKIVHALSDEWYITMSKQYRERHITPASLGLRVANNV